MGVVIYLVENNKYVHSYTVVTVTICIRKLYLYYLVLIYSHAKN